MEEGAGMDTITETVKIFVEDLKTPDTIKKFVGLEFRKEHWMTIPNISLGHTNYSWQMATDLACEYVILRNDKDIQQEQFMSNNEKQLTYYERIDKAFAKYHGLPHFRSPVTERLKEQRQKQRAA